MSTKKLVAVLVLVLGLGIQSVNAAPITFNFMDYANVNGEKGYEVLVWPSGALTLTVTADAAENDPVQYAYTDNGDANNPGGLGVCKDVDGSNQCEPLGEDNMTPGEVLHFMFNQDVNITELVFSNHAFARITTAVGITADAIPSVLTLAQRDASKLSVNPVSYSGSHFTMTASDGPAYLTSMTIVPVPEPGSLSLMGLGILGLSFLRRRK